MDLTIEPLAVEGEEAPIAETPAVVEEPVVAMAAMRDLDLPHDRVNVNGGACALGHPIGCSGARILVTLVSALRERGLKRGIASLCIGGGEATAMAVEVA